MDALHISISAETLFHVGSFAVTNSMLTSMVVTVLILLLAFSTKANLKTQGKPSKFQSLMEVIIESLNSLIESIAGKGKKLAIFGPFIVSFFMFILLNNWIGLLPGVGTIGILEKESVAKVESTERTSTEKVEEVSTTETTQVETHIESSEKEEGHTKFVPLFRPATADLNTTLALALISMTMVQVFGIKFQKLSYFSKFINFSSPINFIVGILELVSEFAKIVSFSFRLFGNIFAGEVLLTVIMALVPVVVPMPFYGLEIFVGFIQSVVFSILSLVFFNMATIGHHEEHA